MKVFVTGGAGYVGGVTTELLLDRGHEVTIFDNLGRGHRSALDPRAAFIPGDLRRSQEICQALRETRPDAVLHFAACALVGESMKHPWMYYENNVIGGLNLLNAAREADVGIFIFSSTCATYGTPSRMPISEDTPQCPENPYGESKLALERALTWFERIEGRRCVLLRYFNACGATEERGEDHDPETHLIPLVLRVPLGQRESIDIYGTDYDTPDGTCIRDYIHVSDLAEAHVKALESSASGPFNLGTGIGYSVRQVIDAARRLTGHPIPARECQRRPGDPPTLVAEARRAAEVLDWRPRRSDLERIVADAWAWHRRNPDGYAD